MGDNVIASSRRTDDQLLFILDQTAEWTVHGRAGVALALLESLREALRAVFRFEADGVHVFAISRRPRKDVIVFREQMGRLADTDGSIGRELQHTAPVWANAVGVPIFRRILAGSRGWVAASR